MEALKEGFYEIVPKNISETFDEFELKVRKKIYIYLLKYLNKLLKNQFHYDIFIIINNLL